VDGGTLLWQSTGTVTTLRVSDGGTADYSEDIRPRTVTNCSLSSRAALLDPFRTVTFTNPIALARCKLAELRELDLGTHITLAVAAGA
jgi:hypothetical protein